MKTRATVCNVPPESSIRARLADAYFHDCYAIAVPRSTRNALGHFLTALARTPRWVDRLMSLRNKVVGAFGMKDLGLLGDIDLSKPDSAYLAGDLVGIFTLLSNTPDEALLGVTERHFDVVVSIYKRTWGQDSWHSIEQTTVVRVHTWLGKLYMLPVIPFHRHIARTVMSLIS